MDPCVPRPHHAPTLNLWPHTRLACLAPAAHTQQMFFRATLFSAFGASKRWLGTNADGTTRPLGAADFYKASSCATL